MRKLIVATHNSHKLAEIRAILADLPNFQIVCLADYPQIAEVIEDQDSFRGNAAKKALEVAKQLNQLVIADDSGLCVDALGGEPGVYSARYAGPGADSTALCNKLLANLANVPAAKRTARFTTVIALADANGVQQYFEGTVDGLIGEEMRGDQGFGYDPVFIYEPLGLTFAQIPAAQKNSLSHRYRALAKLKQYLLTLK